VTVLATLVVPNSWPENVRLEGESVTKGLPPTRLNVAVTDLAAFMVTEQAPVPLQAPLQPPKLEPATGVAVSMTVVPLLKFAEHVPGQLIPAGLLLTLPLPVPAKITDN